MHRGLEALTRRSQIASARPSTRDAFAQSPASRDQFACERVAAITRVTAARIGTSATLRTFTVITGTRTAGVGG
jgi:hypothetical protein